MQARDCIFRSHEGTDFSEKNLGVEYPYRTSSFLLPGPRGEKRSCGQPSISSLAPRQQYEDMAMMLKIETSWFLFEVHGRPPVTTLIVAFWIISILSIEAHEALIRMPLRLILPWVKAEEG